MKLVVTGGRDFKSWGVVYDVLDKLMPKYVFVGDCPTGADKFVRDWCDYRRISYTIFAANWDKFGKNAGPIRNEEMLRKAGPYALVLAFPGGRGTENCVREAQKLKMTVMRVEG